MATSKTTPGFKVTCPFCGATDETVHLDLNNLESLTCSGCSEEFTAEQARAKAAESLARWEAVCRWLALASDLQAN